MISENAALTAPVRATLPPDLLKAIRTLAKVVNPHTFVPILSTILVESDGTTIVARATDLEIQAEYRCKAASPESFAFAIDAKRFADVALCDGPLEARIETLRVQMNGKVTGGGGGTSHVFVPALPAEEYPPRVTYVPNPAGDGRVELSFAELMRAFTIAAGAASDEEARGAVLGSVLFELGARFLGNGKNAHPSLLVLTSTDGFRLLHQEVSSGDVSDQKRPRSYIVPKGVLRVLKAIKFDKKAPPNVTVLFDGRTAIFSVAGFTLHVRLVDGQYPNYQAVVPKLKTADVRVNAAALAVVVKAAAKVAKADADKRSRYAGTVDLVQGFGANKLIVQARSDAAGTFEQIIDTRGALPCEKIGFNGIFLAELLEVFGKADVELQLTGPLSPLVVTDDLRTTIAVLMPVRL